MHVMIGQIDFVSAATGSTTVHVKEFKDLTILVGAAPYTKRDT